MAVDSYVLETAEASTIYDLVFKVLMFVARLWVGIIVGVLVGWIWKPKWANSGRDLFNSSKLKDNLPSSSCFVGSISRLNSLKTQLPRCLNLTSNCGDEKEALADSPTPSISSSSKLEGEKLARLTEEDLKNLYRLVEEKDGGPSWIQMMDRSTATMSYQAWRRDPQTGPPQYRSRTVFEDATPQMVRDFFWDDEFRKKWDDMLISAQTLEDCSATGTMAVRWVRKGIPCSSIPRQNKPKRVDLYYSSWCIRAVESRKGNSQLTACEVLLFHHEDMGIPWEIAKLGVRQGMWGAVKKIDPALRSYQKHRATEAPLSNCALMANINTKVSIDYLRCSEDASDDSSDNKALEEPLEKPAGKNLPKLLIVGGAIALACSLDHGLLTKAVVFGVARRFSNIGKR
uniref:START domain-containing protein n=1 Tax=Cucumis sativus TaxID=3659 RepID=A0A0A0KK71_CUCSA